jgi:hypothetical protein
MVKKNKKMMPFHFQNSLARGFLREQSYGSTGWEAQFCDGGHECLGANGGGKSASPASIKIGEEGSDRPSGAPDLFGRVPQGCIRRSGGFHPGYFRAVAPGSRVRGKSLARGLYWRICKVPGATADPSTSLRSGRDDSALVWGTTAHWCVGMTAHWCEGGTTARRSEGGMTACFR